MSDLGEELIGRYADSPGVIRTGEAWRLADRLTGIARTPLAAELQRRYGVTGDSWDRLAEMNPPASAGVNEPAPVIARTRVITPAPVSRLLEKPAALNRLPSQVTPAPGTAVQLSSLEFLMGNGKPAPGTGLALARSTKPVVRIEERPGFANTGTLARTPVVTGMMNRSPLGITETASTTESFGPPATARHSFAVPPAPSVSRAPLASSPTPVSSPSPTVQRSETAAGEQTSLSRSAATSTASAEAPDPDAIADEAVRRLLRNIEIEAERRGWT